MAIRLEREEEDLHSLYAPILEGFAQVHLLAVASLEAHINEQGFILLKGVAWDNFEKMSLEAKWLFLPRLCGAEGFDPGAEPFQSFSQIIKRRNALAHYKPHAEDWRPPGVPQFIEKLGLTKEASEQALRTVTLMVKNLAAKLRLDEPYWVSAKDWSFFIELEFRTRDERRKDMLARK